MPGTRVRVGPLYDGRFPASRRWRSGLASDHFLAFVGTGAPTGQTCGFTDPASSPVVGLPLFRSGRPRPLTGEATNRRLGSNRYVIA